MTYWGRARKGGEAWAPEGSRTVGGVIPRHPPEGVAKKHTAEPARGNKNPLIIAAKIR